MVEILAAYPTIHQTFNLVPSLVEQLEDYASGGSADVYWEHTMKPAADLSPSERAFIVERMCERSDHPRAKSHPRYLELARKTGVGGIPGMGRVRRTVHRRRTPRPPGLVQSRLVRPDPAGGSGPRRAGRARPRLPGRGQADPRPGPARHPGQGHPRLQGGRRSGADRAIHLSLFPSHPPAARQQRLRPRRRGRHLLPHRRFAHPEDAWEQVRAARPSTSGSLELDPGGCGAPSRRSARTSCRS